MYTHQSLYFQFVSIGNGNGRRLMTYHHLKYIELYEVSFEDTKEVLVVLQLIVNSPILKTLQVSVSLLNLPRFYAPTGGSLFMFADFCRFPQRLVQN